MKTIGLIGGLSWKSSIEYYRIINEEVNKQLGGLHSAKCVMYSFDFEEVVLLQHQGRWDEATERLTEAARNLERGRADLLLICTNTMHKMADQVQDCVTIPLLHIADATAEKIIAQGLKTVGLLGTAFTMEQDFYTGRLTRRYGLEVLVPDEEERKIVHNVIYKELCAGVIKASSREAYKQIVAKLVARGAEAIILGCTEIMLLLKQEDSPVPLFDTTQIHAQAAVAHALQ
jgi:aspartate racemase